MVAAAEGRHHRALGVCHRRLLHLGVPGLLVGPGVRTGVVGAAVLGGALAMSLAAGCVQPPAPPPTPAEAPAPAPAAPVRDPLEDDAVRAALAAAERALAEDRLLTPADDNAHLHFQRALALAPNLPEARLGMERVVERYLALAGSAMRRQRWAAGRTMLDRAAVVSPAHPSIAPMRRQLELLANAERLTMDLEPRAVRARSIALAGKLAAFGGNARRANARVTIRAGSDADGRWIHEQLRQAPGTTPVRGSIEIGRPPRVTIVLFNLDGDQGGEG